MSQSKSALQQLQAQFSQEREHLAQQLQELAMEHQHRECRLQEAHCCAMQDMEEAQQMELTVAAPYIEIQPCTNANSHTNASVADVRFISWKLLALWMLCEQIFLKHTFHIFSVVFSIQEFKYVQQ